jgi:putative ABC transport system permease protein
MLSIGASFRVLGAEGTRDDRLIVTAAGNRTINRDTLLTFSNLEGVKRNDGKPLVSGVMFGFAEGRKQVDNVRVMYGVRGVEPIFLTMYPELQLTDGRMFQAGLNEVIVGAARRAATKGLELGDHIRMRGNDWLVVGHYRGIGYIDDGALADAETLMAALKQNSFAYMAASLKTTADLEPLKQAVKANPTLGVDVETEAKFLARQVKEVTQLVDFISYFIASVMTTGATVGAVNIMYMIVDQRRREIVTLRAIGFKAFPIVVAVMLESILIAIPGALLGASVAWIMFNGHHVTPFGFSLDLAVTASVVAMGIGWAPAMGVIGGLSPALRMARAPVADALRAT